MTAFGTGAEADAGRGADRESQLEEHTERFLASAPDQPCSCAELRDRLFEFLDRELADSECARLERHVAECEHCTEATHAEEHIRHLLKRSCTEQAPQGLRSRVVAQLTVLRTTEIYRS